MSRPTLDIPAADYSGPIFAEDHYGWQDGFFFDGVAGLLEWCEDEEEAVPAFVYATTFRPFQLHLGAAIEMESEEHHEDIDSQLVGVEELHAVVKAWNEMQTGGTYDTDYNTRIIINPEALNATS